MGRLNAAGEAHNLDLHVPLAPGSPHLQTARGHGCDVRALHLTRSRTRAGDLISVSLSFLNYQTQLRIVPASPGHRQA